MKDHKMMKGGKVMKKIAEMLVLTMLISVLLCAGVLAAPVPAEDPTPFEQDFSKITPDPVDKAYNDATLSNRPSIGANSTSNGTMVYADVSETAGGVSLAVKSTVAGTGISPRLNLTAKSGKVKVETSIKLKPETTDARMGTNLYVKGRDSGNASYNLARFAIDSNGGVFVHGSSGTRILSNESDFLYGEWLHLTFDIDTTRGVVDFSMQCDAFGENTSKIVNAETAYASATHTITVTGLDYVGNPANLDGGVTEIEVIPTYNKGIIYIDYYKSKRMDYIIDAPDFPGPGTESFGTNIIDFSAVTTAQFKDGEIPGIAESTNDGTDGSAAEIETLPGTTETALALTDMAESDRGTGVAYTFSEERRNPVMVECEIFLNSVLNIDFYDADQNTRSRLRFLRHDNRIVIVDVNGTGIRIPNNSYTIQDKDSRYLVRFYFKDDNLYDLEIINAGLKGVTPGSGLGTIEDFTYRIENQSTGMAGDSLKGFKIGTGQQTGTSYVTYIKTAEQPLNRIDYMVGEIAKTKTELQAGDALSAIFTLSDENCMAADADIFLAYYVNGALKSVVMTDASVQTSPLNQRLETETLVIPEGYNPAQTTVKAFLWEKSSLKPIVLLTEMQ